MLLFKTYQHAWEQKNLPAFPSAGKDREGSGGPAGRRVPPHLQATCTHSLPPRFNTPPCNAVAGPQPYHNKRSRSGSLRRTGYREGEGMEMSRGWQELGVVDTIYEDDHEEEEEYDDHEGQEEERFDSPTMSSSPPTSRSSSPGVEDAAAVAEAHPSSLPPALRRAVQAWYVRAAMSCGSVRLSISGHNNDDFTDRSPPVQVPGERVAQARRGRPRPGASPPSAQGNIRLLSVSSSSPPDARLPPPQSSVCAV